MNNSQEGKLNVVVILEVTVALLFSFFLWSSQRWLVRVENAQANTRTRVAEVEKRVEGLQIKAREIDRQSDRNEKRLQRIEEKLDRILERVGRNEQRRVGAR